ncbi:MAG: hypothetical protein LBU34_14320 [Planctomycetaceae bacterium]|nr:hypothetical protein [Planctomycetaceae bacterium]
MTREKTLFRRIFFLTRRAGGAKPARNLRIRIFQPDTKTKGRQSFAEGFSPMIASALADREFVQCWMFRLPRAESP